MTGTQHEASVIVDCALRSSSWPACRVSSWRRPPRSTRISSWPGSIAASALGRRSRRRRASGRRCSSRTSRASRCGRSPVCRQPPAHGVAAGDDSGQAGVRAAGRPRRPIPPVLVSSSVAPCQEVVLRPPFDILRLIPATTSTESDAGPVPQHGPAPRRGPRDRRIGRDVPSHVPHRPGHDDGQFHRAVPPHRSVPGEERTARANPFPCRSASASTRRSSRHVVQGADHAAGIRRLTIAGGLRGRAVALVDCVSVAAKALARAEIVIEGEESEPCRWRQRGHDV